MSTTKKLQSKASRKKKWGDITLQVVMTIVAILFLVPVFIIFNYSFKTKKELYLGNAFALPQSVNFDNYAAAYKKLNLGTTFFNTLLYTVISVLILALVCGMTAWAIARCKRRFFQFSYIYFIVGYLIPYEDWSLSELQERTALVQEFDRLADAIVSAGIETAETHEVVEEIFYEPVSKKCFA